MGAFIRFLTTGVLSFSTDFTTYLVLVGLIGLWAPVAGVLAYAAAFCVNFFVNRSWTYDSAGAGAGSQLLRYVLLVLANTGIVFVGLAVLTASGWGAVTAKLVLVVLMTPVNFLIMRQWVFRDRTDEVDSTMPASGAIGAGR
ncbi:MAG: GtrA family protein [Actinobacteria bacterium]|nr:GtrA family protein [Actinomycetota bacterium]